MSESTTTKLICPKCGGEMRTYETNEVIVDQCQECRGLFLDRGELDRLITAGESHYAARESRSDPGDDNLEGTSRLDREDDETRRREGFLGGGTRRSGC